MGTTKLAYQISTALVVVLFAFAGTVKVFPGISPDIHNEMKSNFHGYARVPPVSALHLKPEFYMLMVGILELTCVGLLLFGRARPAVLATWTLLLLMAGAVYTHVAVGDELNKAVPAIVAFCLVLIRLYTMGALEDVKIKVKI